MQSESLRNIKTLRQVRAGPEAAIRGIKTTNRLSRTPEEIEQLESPADQRLPQVLERERRRFHAQDAALEKSRQRLCRARRKLAVTINRNRALTSLRHELQRARWEDNSAPLLASRPQPAEKFNQLELRY